jgi:hypothetical protein
MRDRARYGGRLLGIAAVVCAGIVIVGLPSPAAALLTQPNKPEILWASRASGDSGLALTAEIALSYDWSTANRTPLKDTEELDLIRSDASQPLSLSSRAERSDLGITLGRRSTGGLEGPKLSLRRTAAWGGANLAAMWAAYKQSQTSWGESNGKFHFKDDFKGDGMAMSDEVSHLFAAYRLMQVLDAGYRWIGASPRAARRWAAVEAWLWTFAIEYPIDAYNPSQGFGVSDLLFNTAGVLAAYHRSGQQRPRWDVKISVKRQFFDGNARVIAHTNKQYDDYIYWLTVRPSFNRCLPFLLGAGYSTTHPAGGGITKELHLAVGTTLEEIGGIFGERTARYLRPLNVFFFNFGTKISWR